MPMDAHGCPSIRLIITFPHGSKLEATATAPEMLKSLIKKSWGTGTQKGAESRAKGIKLMSNVKIGMSVTHAILNM